MASVAVAFLVGALLGSIPAAWLLVRWRLQKDLRTEGSTNVGALNALKVSRSPGVGLAAVLLDALKGTCAVWAAVGLSAVFDVERLPLQVAGTLGVVAGHNYNPWLSISAGRLAGGKGFAAAAGALLAFRPLLVLVWFGLVALSWPVFKLWRGITDEVPATTVATLGLVPAAWWLYDGPTVVCAVGCAVLVFPKLVRELRELLFSAS